MPPISSVVDRLIDHGHDANINTHEVTGGSLLREKELIAKKNLFERRILRDSIDNWVQKNETTAQETAKGLRELREGIEFTVAERTTTEVVKAGATVVGAAADEVTKLQDSSKPLPDRIVGAGGKILGVLGIVALARAMYNYASGGEEGGRVRKWITRIAGAGMLTAAAFILNAAGESPAALPFKPDAAPTDEEKKLVEELKNTNTTKIDFSNARLKPGMDLLKLGTGINLSNGTGKTLLEFQKKNDEYLLKLGADFYRVKTTFLGLPINLSKQLNQAKVVIDTATTKRYIQVTDTPLRYVEEKELAASLEQMRANPAAGVKLNYLMEMPGGTPTVNGKPMKASTQDLTAEKVTV